MTVMDIRTIFTGYVLSILLCVIVMTSLWWQNRKRSPEIALWLANCVLQFIALLLIIFRGILPDLATIVLANLLIIGGTVILFIGLGRYVGKKIHQGHNYVMLAIFTIVHLYLTYVHPDLGLRTVNQSLALLYICAQGSWLMLRGVNADLKPATRAIGIVFAAICLISVLQIVVNLSLPKVNNLFVSGFFGVVAILMYEILFIALTFTLFILVSRRLSTALEDELFQRMQAEEKFTKAFQTTPNSISITRLEDGKFIEVNDAFADLIGYSREEAVAQTSIGIRLWVNEKDREEMTSVLRRGLPVMGREFLFRRKNGEIFTGLYSAQTIQLDHDLCLLSSIYDITESKMANELIRSRLSLREFAATHSLEDILQKTLDEIGALVNSPIGFYHFVEEDQKTLSLQAWSTRTVKEFCKAEGKGMHYEINQAGVWVDCVREKRTVIHNNYNLLPHRKGLPEGHAAVVRELVVPIMRDGNIVAILGVGNKPVDYTEKDVEIVSYLADVAWEITKHKQAEEALKKSEEQVRLLLNSTAEAIYGIDIQCNCTFANPSCLRMLGYANMEQMLGRNMHELIHHSYPDGNPMTINECAMMMAFHEGAGMHRDDEVFWRADGTSFPVEYWSYPQMVNGEISGAVVTFIDITERKRAEERIKHLATHDLLTDLPSMSLAKDRLSLTINMARRYKKAAAVMFIDLDSFKAVNDTFGHDAGDYVLKQVAKRLLSCVRETDTVARVGGDEFLIIASEINAPENVAQIAEKVIQLVSQPIVFNGQQAVVGTSIGIALFPEHSEDMDKLIKLADEAMYKVKNAGKNGFRFVDNSIK